MNIVIQWQLVNPTSSLWNMSRCLYAYGAPRSREILYVGKAWGTSIRARWNREAKAFFWIDLERERKLFEHTLIVGTCGLAKPFRLTRELLADVESLLIYAEKPWGNIQSSHSRIRRPGMVVHCKGSWPGTVRTYIDD